METFGITTDTQVLFDSNGNGIKTATGWVSSDDGILVLDRNGNGTIKLKLSSSSLFLEKSKIKNREPDVFLIYFSKQKQRGLRNSLCSNSPRPNSSLFSLKAGNAYAHTSEAA